MASRRAPVLPYVATLENEALTAAAARTHFEVRGLLAISVAQTAILLAIAVVVGQWAARKLGLGTPLITALLTRRPAPENTLSTLIVAFALGIVTALTLMLLDRWVFAPIPSVADLIHNVENGSAKPSAWQGLLASFYGALDEEILMRFGLVSLLALAFRTLTRMRREDRELALPTGVFWAANIVAAMLFGLGHLPMTAALAPHLLHARLEVPRLLSKCSACLPQPKSDNATHSRGIILTPTSNA